MKMYVGGGIRPPPRSDRVNNIDLCPMTHGLDYKERLTFGTLRVEKFIYCYGGSDLWTFLHRMV